MPERPHLVVVTGMSGAGRSTAAKVLEDSGFFVIDNLPARLIGHVVADADLPDNPRKRLAVVVDTRGGLRFDDLDTVLTTMQSNEVPTTLLFLDATDEVLLKRYEENRRPHPVDSGTLGESVATEREALGDLRAKADIIVDTSDLNVHQLRERLMGAFAGSVPDRPMRVSVDSFGFKHGSPRVADLVLDVRFLPNPHWEAELRPLTGKDEAVRRYVIDNEDAIEFMDRTKDMLGFLLPRYEREGKSYLTVGVGCTGGHHRSVAIAEELGDWLRDEGWDVTVRHRDVER